MFDTNTKLELIKGNPEAYKEVFRILYPRLKGYCRLFISDQNETEDIIQECFLTLWIKRSTINVNLRVESLMFVMLRNRCLNYLKSKKLIAENISVENIDMNELQYLYQLDLLNREEKSLEEQLIASFQEAVNILPPKMKDVFVKCKIEGKNQKEVAKELNLSIKTVEKHISNAKEKIKLQLMKNYPDSIVFSIIAFSILS